MIRKFLSISAVLILLFVGLALFVSPLWWWAFLVIGPLFLMGIADMFTKRHTIVRNFPLIGRFRYLFENIRPEIYQYFIESDIDGRPFNRTHRSIVYQRAKKELDTVPFGSKLDAHELAYEWLEHSMYPVSFEDREPRVSVGGAQCSQPYSASILNISAMSYGALGRNAILALSKGAAQEGFAHNTGEGGISPYHLEGGADLVWQIGTGYFGCRDKEGNFNPELFQEEAKRPQVRMIEIKISQGAKPGHGGILPKEKNTPEIARIRRVEPHTRIMSPPWHSAFSDAPGLLRFIGELRELSGGKPVGFKLCPATKKEFMDVCEAMKDTGVRPDFITVDGTEGGTGAAPLEFSDHIGMPFHNAMAFVNDTLVHYGLRDDIRLIGAGKIITGFDMIRAMALGADICNSARGMMFALGCIQALRCNSGHCPTGVSGAWSWMTKKSGWPITMPRPSNLLLKCWRVPVSSLFRILTGAC